MPQVFKALSTIMAWVLWASALITGFSTLAMGIISRDLYNSDRVTPMVYPAFAVAGFFATVAVVIIVLRKKWNKSNLIVFVSTK